MNKKDSLGDRMKTFYEDRLRVKLQRRTYTILRIDGKAFHTYTRGLKRPFDQGLMDDMDATAAYLCKNIQGAKLAYVQSDEISIVITDFDELTTDMWFDGNLQKMVSVAASLAAAKFNQLRMVRSCKENGIDGYAVAYEGTMMTDREIESFKLATFDARALQVSSLTEVENYLIWRQQDATRNSIASVAQSMYSDKELHGKNCDAMQELIFQRGTNWNDYTFREKRGGIVTKVAADKNGATRSTWQLVETPVFTQNREFIKLIIPNLD